MHGVGMLTPKRKNQMMNSEVTKPIKITGGEVRGYSAWE